MPLDQNTTSSPHAPTQPIPSAGGNGMPTRTVPAARSPVPRRNHPNWWLVLLLLAIGLIIIVAIISNLGNPFRPVPVGHSPDLAPQTFQIGDHGQVVFKAHTSNISVRSADTDTIRIEPRKHNSVVPPDEHAVQVIYQRTQDDQGHDRLTISPDPWFKAIDFAVTIPNSLLVQITVDSGSLDIHGGQGITADTSNGSIALEDVHGPVNVHTNSGDITANNIYGPVEIKAENGSIKLVHPEGEVHATTRSGDVDVDDGALSGHSVLQTQNGSVRFSGSLDPQGTYRMQTTSGDVQATLPANAAFTLDAGTNSGSVQNTFGGTEVGESPRPPLSMHTTNGSVVLVKSGG